jgi:hemerythrin superfamily protein
MRDHVSDGEEAVEVDTREHEAIERTLKDLERVEASEPRFMELVGRLRELLEQHATSEEGSQFPALRAAVPRETLVELREKVDTAKKLAPTRAHPNAPNAELFHKLVGPGVGLVDRLRDKLSGRG